MVLKNLKKLWSERSEYRIDADFRAEVDRADQELKKLNHKMEICFKLSFFSMATGLVNIIGMVVCIFLGSPLTTTVFVPAVIGCSLGFTIMCGRIGYLEPKIKILKNNLLIKLSFSKNEKENFVHTLKKSLFLAPPEAVDTLTDMAKDIKNYKPEFARKTQRVLVEFNTAYEDELMSTAQVIPTLEQVFGDEILQTAKEAPECELVEISTTPAALVWRV